jgi:hypothetical protein
MWAVAPGRDPTPEVALYRVAFRQGLSHNRQRIRFADKLHAVPSDLDPLGPSRQRLMGRESTPKTTGASHSYANPASSSAEMGDLGPTLIIGELLLGTWHVWAHP